MRYQFWDKTSNVYTPSGEQFSPEQWSARYPWVNIPGAKMVIASGLINGGFCMEFGSMKDAYARSGAVFTDEMTDGEVLQAMEDFEDNPPGADEPSVEERTAAALEFLAVSNLPDDE